eukprot:TRINITY_DN3491_c0_g1_i1.p1 TRINITY_DN3491_c0_g1~~TRINITY_DN3491_c0_g1_i1.p1  ORF type:complete len:979 (+),score=272.72 TRINITY_DN3491_c0_g1_i1:71-3007(+)
MEPPTKKAKIDGSTTLASMAPKEVEQDAAPDKGAKIKDAACFHVEDTTMNLMLSQSNRTLMSFTEGGLQYLFAGARANVGIASGRYMFEVKVLELMCPLDDPNSRRQVPQPKSQVRIGFSTERSVLFLGETEDSVCFDSEGCLHHNKRKHHCGQKFSTGDVVSILLNLDKSSPNAQTVSLFCNGVRVAQPQALPEKLRGQKLFPAISFKNSTLHYNFGPRPISPLPFKCRMVGDATQKDVVVKAATAAPKDGKYDVIFPISIPDQGGFDWLEKFLSENPQYTELSDRAVLNWCEFSGLLRPKGYSAAARDSNDKPGLGFGIVALDDLSIRQVLQNLGCMQKRHFVVMNMAGNLTKEARAAQVNAWADFRRIVTVTIGEPPKNVIKFTRELMLQLKQETSDSQFRLQQAAEKARRTAERKLKQQELDRKKAVKAQHMKQEEMKRRFEFEQKKKEAKDKGLPEPVEEKAPEEPEDDREFQLEPEPEEQDPPKVELTEEEKNQIFRKPVVHDLSPSVLYANFKKFTLPEKDEGFDEIRYEWQKESKAQQHFIGWINEIKQDARIEDLQPSDWFQNKWKEWQKILQTWHAKQNQFKAAEVRRQNEAAARAAKRRAREAAKAKAEREGKTLPDQPQEVEPESFVSKADSPDLDVFGIEDVMDLGNSEPLFATFCFEDWTVMGLRVELHLLVRAFLHDAKEPCLAGMPLQHLGYYYQTYFKKELSSKFYGVSTDAELLELVQDAVVLNRQTKVLEPQLPPDLASWDIFVMLTEEARRDRLRRIDMGDESAKLKISGGLAAASATASSIAGIRPPQHVPKPKAPVQATPMLAQKMQQQQQFNRQQPDSSMAQKGKGGQKGFNVPQMAQMGSAVGGKGFEGFQRGKGFDGFMGGKGFDAPMGGKGFEGPMGGKGFDFGGKGGFDFSKGGKGFDLGGKGGFDFGKGGKGFDAPMHGKGFNGPMGGKGMPGPPPSGMKGGFKGWTPPW